jgi:hypothetical protein
MYSVRVLEASGCRYNADACFGGVTAYDIEAYKSTNGYPNGFWGWGGEDHAAYDRVSAVDNVEIERVKEVNFEDLERDVETIEKKLARLDCADARIKMKEKHKLLLRNRKFWRDDGLSSLKFDVLHEDPVRNVGGIKIVKYTCAFLTDRPGYLTCSSCARNLREDVDFSKTTMYKVTWQRDKKGVQTVEATCRECVANHPKQALERANLEKNALDPATRLTCATCAVIFASRTSLFRHLKSTPCGHGLES